MGSTLPHFKIVLLGDTGVGKTALVDRVSKDVFSLTHVPTVGAQFISVEMSVEDHPCVLEIWDTAGQELFRSLVGFYTRDAKGCFILFDLTKQASYSGLPEWFNFIQENAPETQIILFGNKKDLQNERQVTFDCVTQFAESKKCPYFEGSAKTAQGVRDAFDRMSELVVAKAKKRESSVVTLMVNEESEKKECC
jgi:small GTP-binding protein